jgi:hypothetical protein
MEKKYTVTEKELRAFYDAKGKVADALWLEHQISPSRRLFDIWNDNAGPSFEFLLESVRLRNGEEEE